MNETNSQSIAIQLQEIPHNYNPVYYFPKESSIPHDGVIVQFISESHNWIGVFAFGSISKAENSSAIYQFNGSSTVCIISKGEGYLVHINEPAKTKHLAISPIIDSIYAADQNILILADYTRLMAIGKGGERWTTPRISWDGIKITKADNGMISARVQDIPNDRELEVEVNLEDGVVKNPLENLNYMS